jgi:bacillithiol biosynthesis cysteine-adding enzyme BshC
LTAQNRLYGSSEATFENIEKLRSPKTAAIVTGQQVGLFAGSLYTIYKTASVLALQKQYSRLFPDYQFAPIFWLEGEDHDYEEIAAVSLIAGNELKTLRYDEKNHSERKMIGRTVLSSDITGFIDGFLSALPQTDFTASISDAIRAAYAPGETFLTAFAKLMNTLFRADGIIFLSADDARFKSLAKEIFIREFETFPKSSEAVIAQSALLEEAGFEAQAKAKPINFYAVDDFGKRWSVEPQNEKYFSLKPSREELLSSALLDMTHNAPEKLSPNVILRPILQDEALPTLCYVAGPGEVAYWAQLKKAYQFFGVEMPLVAPRASLTIVEQKISKVFEKLGGEFREVKYAQFFFERERLQKEQLASRAEVDIETAFKGIEDEIKLSLAKLGSSLRRIDPSLEQTLETAQGKMLFQLSQLKEKAFRAEKQKQSELIAQLEKCDLNLLPNGKMQERVLNVCGFINKYGFDFMNVIKQVVESSEWNAHLAVEL